MSWIWINDKNGDRDIIASANIWGLYLAIRDTLDHMGFKVLFEIETAETLTLPFVWNDPNDKPFPTIFLYLSLNLL